ncbi:MAG: hypothetical protein ABWY00_06130 [Dongiaceae bacterium]
MATQDDAHPDETRAELIRKRARRIWEESGSDVYSPEHYEQLAERLIAEEENAGLSVNPYPINQESDRRK